MKKIWIAAGGTGGHFYPGLAVAKALQADGVEVSFIVKKNDFVIPLLQRENIPFFQIFASGFDRHLSFKNIVVLLKLSIGVLQCVFRFFQNRPDGLLVMGGYLSVAPALVAKLFRVPRILHEQNVYPGLANRFLSTLVNQVAISFGESQTYFEGKAVLTGNPLRSEFQTWPSHQESCLRFNLDPLKKTILVFGGSLGAHRLNELMIQTLPGLPEFSSQIQILHFTGSSDKLSLEEAYKKMNILFYVEAYCHQMPMAYSAADLVICRAGASTITELLAVKKPALLIPYPHATDDHQTANAKVLVDLGVGKMVSEVNLTAESFREILKGILKDSRILEEWSKNYQKLKVEPASSSGKVKNLLMEKIPPHIK